MHALDQLDPTSEELLQPYLRGLDEVGDILHLDGHQMHTQDRDDEQHPPPIPNDQADDDAVGGSHMHDISGSPMQMPNVSGPTMYDVGGPSMSRGWDQWPTQAPSPFPPDVTAAYTFTPLMYTTNVPSPPKYSPHIGQHGIGSTFQHVPGSSAAFVTRDDLEMSVLGLQQRIESVRVSIIESDRVRDQKHAKIMRMIQENDRIHGEQHAELMRMMQEVQISLGHQQHVHVSPHGRDDTVPDVVVTPTPSGAACDIAGATPSSSEPWGVRISATAPSLARKRTRYMAAILRSPYTDSCRPRHRNTTPSEHHKFDGHRKIDQEWMQTYDGFIRDGTQT
jgi:hypothetical protein